VQDVNSKDFNRWTYAFNGFKFSGRHTCDSHLFVCSTHLLHLEPIYLSECVHSTSGVGKNRVGREGEGGMVWIWYD
jgi:hypothetical protein